MTRKLALGAMLGLLASGPAIACDCVRLNPEGPRFAADLDRIASFYPVAAEGVLERDGAYSWRFTPTKEFRGNGKKSYSIGLISDCSLAPDELNALIGKPIFALLVEGPGDHRGTYEISRCVNLLGPEIEGAIRRRVVGKCKTR